MNRDDRPLGDAKTPSIPALMLLSKMDGYCKCVRNETVCTRRNIHK
jgi:hypothetical protein